MVSIAMLLVLAAAPDADFKLGNDYFAQYKYAEARASMAKAKAKPGLDRAKLLRILEVQAIAAGQMRQGEAARDAFRELLLIDPEHKLGAEYAPRVTTPFFEARQGVLDTGALSFVPAPPAVADGKITAIGVVVKDPASLAKSVRFHVGEKTAAFKVPEDGSVTLQVDGGELVSWWAELLGENTSQLQLIGSAKVPRVEKAPEKPIAPPPAPPLEAAGPSITQPASTPAVASPLRGIGIAAWGVAAASAAAGAIFAVSSSADFSKIDRATRDQQGIITGLTEKDAYALSASGGQKATIANSLFIGAGVLAAGGLVLFLVGAPSERVAVAPTPNGVSVSGRF
jgi:hypothetical protein